jgi:hypothetical protein
MRKFTIGRGIAMLGGLQFAHGVTLLAGPDAPVSGVNGTGYRFAGPGSVYYQTTGQRYVNLGTSALPDWRANPPSSSASPSVSPS